MAVVAAPIPLGTAATASAILAARCRCAPVAFPIPAADFRRAWRVPAADSSFRSRSSSKSVRDRAGQIRACLSFSHGLHRHHPPVYDDLFLSHFLAAARAKPASMPANQNSTASTIERTFSLLTEGNRAYSDTSAFLAVSQLFNRHLLHIGYKPHSPCIARSCIREKTENFDDAKSCRQTEKTETSPRQEMTPFDFSVTSARRRETTL